MRIPSVLDLPIRRKLLLIVMATAAVALLLSGAGIVVLDSILFRNFLREDISAVATMAAENSTAALAFNDERAAQETLNTLHVKPHVVIACIYRMDGSILARYVRPGASSQCPDLVNGRPELRFTRTILIVRKAVEVEGRRVGTLAILYDLGELSERVQVYSAIVLTVLIVSMIAAFFLSSRLRTIIASPISQLAATARRISDSRDYGLRARKISSDELGVLVDAFNDMVERIQSRDRELSQALTAREQALREAEDARNSLQTTLASIGDAVIATDKEGNIVLANRVAESLLKWPASEMTGKPLNEVFQIVNEFTRARLESPVSKVLRAGGIVGLANHTILIARDGTEVPIDDSGAPIQHDGRIIGVVLVFRDISERRRAEREAAYLAAMVESSNDAIVGTLPDGAVYSWNAGAERIYGYTSDEMIGRRTSDLTPEDRLDEEREIVERLRKGETVDSFETVRLRKDGAAIHVSLTISPIRDKTGQIIGASHVARDITEQRRAAEKMRQTQKLESLGVLAGGIAHDFNNLLTGILGNASLAQEELAPGSLVRARLGDVIAASEKAAQLTRQMLAYSGKGRFVLEQIDLSSRIRETIPLIQASIPRTVKLILNLADELPPIEADASQIQQLLMNIVINGAEAIAEGKPGSVTIATTRYVLDQADAGDLKPGEYVLFEVTDTGSGMDEATRARIFDPFFTTKFTGRGLGLAAVLGIVRGHQGSIRVISEVGKGTTFRILLPASSARAQKTASAAVHEASHVVRRGAVLIVDDEPIVRNLARQSLEHFGWTVLLAEDGAQGLDVFQKQGDGIQCVVLDLTMPVMSGEETLARMQTIRTDIPIILSSGYDEAEAMLRFKDKGLAGFLHKPYRAAALAKAIDKVIL